MLTGDNNKLQQQAYLAMQAFKELNQQKQFQLKELQQDNFRSN
jgi:hypothetical protein